jgi:hypothetical protein
MGNLSKLMQLFLVLGMVAPRQALKTTQETSEQMESEIYESSDVIRIDTASSGNSTLLLTGDNFNSG